ncbi:uncharacterized protein LOC124119039 isoform X2 [Haliotis rufescens]|uniref:uncharacterized protein LOC124119039 isoform X1 n=1 Tax=Haliotis rufescens TaxID=6454 RepID=UPI00201F18A5|nr:uncharacterized protein LOC124119039 isoform X1 [Haliotis rufescens]XP_048249664.1 uncharacterized protein LOC124119039 isoform X2 [Haliotis rufescens]
MSAKVVAQVDEVMKNSNMSELYNRTEVSSMSQGSVIVIFIIIFNPVPQAEVKPDVLVIIKQPTKMKEVFKEGIQRMKEELKNNPDKKPVSDIELDEESLDFEPVYKPSPCESAVMDVASHCKAAYEKFVDMATKEGDYCNPYEFYVSCLKFMVNFFRKDCHVYHVSSAANYYVSQKDPSMAPLTSKCADGNGQVKNINFAPTRADKMCLDGNAVNYMAHFHCPDYLDQIRSNETKGDCNILDGLSSCVYEAMKGLAVSNGKTFECSMKDVKNKVVHYKGNILKQTKLPEICFKTGEGKQACPPFMELVGFVAESCPEAIEKISTETDVESRCKHYEYLLGCGVMVLNRMNYNCKKSQLNTMAVENKAFFQVQMNGFDVMQCTEGGEVELSTVAPFTYYPSCLNVNEYDYIWRYRCKVKVEKVETVNGTACSKLTATMGCFMESMGCSYQNVSMILQKYGRLFIAELNFTLCHEFMKQIDGRACLSSTQPQLEGLTRCMVVLSGLSDDMSHDLSCRTYYEAVRCMENLHADPTCNMEAFDKVLPDYATTALIRTPDLLATLKTTSLPAAPKCSDYIKNAVDIKVPCLDKEFLGKVILGRVCRKFLDNVLDKTLPKFSRCQAIVQCVQTAMYESVRASCTVEQVREAINSTLDDLQTVFPLAANSCSGEYAGQCEGIVVKNESKPASSKCFAYMFTMNTTLLTVEENCNLFISALACLRREFMEVNITCTIKQLGSQIFELVPYMASLRLPFLVYDVMQCRAQVAEAIDVATSDHCSNFATIPLYTSTSVCAQHALGSCTALPGLVQCVGLVLQCNDTTAISKTLVSNSDILIRRLGIDYSKCSPGGGVDSCSSALMKPEGTAAGSKCFAYMFVQNTTLLTLEENCKFFLSGLACVQGELMKVGVSCSIRGLAQDYFNYVRLLASQNTTIFPFDFTQCAAIVAKDGDGKIEDLCSNEDIIPLFVSTSYCAMLAYSNDCGVFRGVVNCVQTSLNCSDNSIITNALITNSDVLVRRIGRNYSGCPKEVEGVDSCSSALMRPEGSAAGSKCFAYMFVQNTTLLTLEENCKFFLSGLACVQGELMKVSVSCSIRGLAQDYFNYVRLLASQNTTIFPFDFRQCAAIVAKDGDGKIEDLCSNEDIIPLFVSTSYCAMLAYSNDCGVFRGVVNCVQSSLNCSDDSTITNALITNSDVLVRRIGRNYSGCPKEVENNNPCPLQGDENFSLAMDVVAECGAILGKFNASIIPEEHACRIYWGVVNCTMEEMSKKGYTKCAGQIVTYLEDYLDTKNKELKDVVPYNFNNCQSNRPTGDVCSNDGTLSHFAGSSLECAPNTVALIRQNNYTCGSLTWLVECVKEVLHKSEMKCPTWKLHNNFYYNSYILQRYNSTLNFNMCDSYSVPTTSPDYYSPCRDYNSIRYSAEAYCMPLLRKLNDTKGSNSCSAYGNLMQCLIYALHRYNCTAKKIHNIAIQNSKIIRDELSEFNPNSCGAPTFTTKSPCLEDNYYGFVMSVMCEADKLKPTEDNCSIPYQLTMCAMNVSSILFTQCTMSNFSAYLQRNKDGFPPAFRPCIDNIQSLIVDRCLLMTNPGANCLAFSTYGIVGTSTCDETNMLLYATSLKCMKRQVQTNCTIMDINKSLKNYFDVISVGAGSFLSAQAIPVITCAESIKTTDISTLPDFCNNVEAIMRILMTFGGSNVSGIFSANNGVIPSCFVLLPAIQSTLQTMVSFVGLPCDTDRMVQLVVNNSDIIREKYPHVDLSNCGKYCPSLLGRGTDPDAPYPAYTSSSSYNGTNYTSSSTMTTNQTYYPFQGQTPYMPSVLRCTTFLYTIFQASAPQETLCRLYTEVLRCMAVKGSIYGDKCMIEDFHDALESYLELANATSMFQVDQCSGSIKKYSSQAPLCENPELLATIANVSCMHYYRYTGGGCSILDNVAECVLGLLNSSSIHCCRDVIKNALISRADITAQVSTDFSSCRATPQEMPSTPGWTMNTGPLYPNTSPPLPSSQYSQGISTRGVTDYPLKPTASYPQPMQPCLMSTLYTWGPYCRHSGFLLARHQADNMTCSIYTDLVNCITLVANYNNFNCSVDDIIMMYQQNSSMFDLTELDHKACTVAPLELRHPEMQSVCADEVVRDYVLKYGCRNFSKENIQYVTPTNFCRKVASTTECIQTMMASFGATCSREESGRFLKGIPRLEYLGCLDECHKKFEPDYRSSCSIYSPLTQELSLCSDKVSMIRGAGLQDQCSTYWPMLVSCIQKRLYEGGAVCDGNNIVGRLRNSSQLLKEKGLESLYNCNALSFSTVCEEKNITTMAVDDCNVDLKKCGQEESVTRCVQSQLQNKTYSVYCSLPQLRGNVLLVLGERGHRPCSEGDLRLNGSRIEVRKDGRWEGFCYGEDWTDHAAGLACNQLGYKYGIAGKSYRSSSVPISTYVNCSGDEEQFGKCDVHKIKEYCQEEAHVTCLDDRTHLELTGNRSGWVVAVRGRKVGLICDQGGWYESKASVVCRSLGFASGETFKDRATWPLPHVSAFHTSFNCKGEEKTLDSCQQEGTWEGDLLDISELNQNSYGQCSMNFMATVYCHDEVRLHTRYSNSTGIVIFKNATLSAPVSGEGFDDKAASVVCRQLGFQKGGISLSFNPFNYYFYKVYSFSNMTCNGDEANLMDCEHNGTYLRYSSKPAVVKCTTGKEEVPDMEVKVNADGRVMISRYGIFGTICNKGWTNREAETICSSMGSDAAYARNLYDQGSNVPKWLYNVKCADGDKSLLDCDFSMTPGVDSCSQDAGVFCFNKSDVPSYSLTNGHYGHVMATLKKEKGVVCHSYYWSNSNARVVCRSLGFNSGEIYTGPHAAPETSSAWFSDSMYCSGDEASLDICNDGNWTKLDISGKQNSSNVYYASSCLSNIFSVFCYGEVRLHTSFFNKTGVLQVANNESKDSYGTFCADNFTDTAAAVACRELGLANSGIALPATTYGSVYSSVGRGNVTCDGSESSILNCSKPSSLYSCSYWNHASILCDDKPEADAPITETKVAEDGRVLVKKHGYWGTVCGSGWNKTDASVVCRALGYDAGFNKTMYRSSVVPQWLGQVNCTGLEKSLMDCKAVEQDCRTNSMVAGVKCYNSSDLAKYTFRPRAGSSNIGHVMVDYKGLSYPLCDWQYLSYEDAGVLCRYFGFPTGKKLEGQRNQSSFDYAWAADFACSNTDTDPNACARNLTVETTGLYRRCYNNLVELSCAKGVSLDPDSSSSGPLVVFFGKSSYKVCADNFTNTAADVACREMGFKGGYMISSVVYNHPSYSFGMTGVDCKGSERSIKECSSLKKPEYIYCSSDKNFVALKCTHGNGPDGSGNTTGQEDMPVKLRGINNVVVIQRDNVWFSICGDNWSDNEASVVCRNMGYKEGLASQSYANADMPIWNYRFNCTGSESSLGSCVYWTNPHEQKICSQTAVATCLNKRIGFSIQGGINGKSGWVLAVDGDRSGIICDYDGWSNDDAGQVCRSQGYEWGEKLPAPPMKKPTDSILMATFRCSGSETDINACIRKQPNETYFFFTSENNTACNSWTAATASCYGKVRLQPFYNSSLGVVLIGNNKQSYSICAEGFDDKAANVVCREVGFPNGGRALGYNPFVHRVHTMGFGNVTCTGSEKALGSCVMLDKYMYNCPSGVPAVVKCNTGEDEITDWKIRTDQGKVLVSRFGVFGEVCSAGFDDVAATIVCKSLGFETGASRNMFSSAEDVPMWIFDMSCSEANTELKSCKHNTGPHPKDYCNNAAGVFCQNKEDMTIYSIEGGTTKNYGYLVAEYKGTKATVCSPVWSSSSANTVCKQLGYAGGQAYFGPMDKPALQDVMAANIDCNSHATLLDMCRTGDWERFKVGNEASANYTCTQGPVKVFCYAELRLHTGLFNKTGIVQLQVNNDWLAVCSDGFDDKAATVVCRQLGLSATGVAEPVAFPGYYSSRYSRGNASCTGTETSFLSCSQEIDQYACPSRRPATVVCRDSSAALMKVIGHGNRGRVIVNKYGINGTVCSSGWDDLDARVYCMEQGFQDGFSSSQYAYRDVPQWISDVGCVGAEKTLLDCPFSTTVDTDTCSRDASVFCFKKEDLATFILTKQPAGEDRVGQVVVSKNGTTQPMCLSHYFSNDDASAVCKSLGQEFVGGQPYYGNLTITGSSDYYWSVSMACSGTEKQADICITHWSLMSDSNRNSTSCRPVHVECFREVRLYPNSLASVGSLVINNDNAWTAVCMDGFTDTSAMVACIEMGYAGGRVMTSSYPASGFSNKFRNVMCTGAEKSLKDCPGEMTKSYATCKNDREATVSCYKKGNQPETTSVAPANDCSNFQYVRNIASACGSQISVIQNKTKPSCDYLLDVAECAATNLCYQTGYYKCSVEDIMMTFRYNSNATRDWLGLHNAKDACDGMAMPHSMCEDKTALTCLVGICAVGSRADFVKLDLPTQCSVLANMSSCVVTRLRSQGQGCSLDDIRLVMTKVVLDTMDFDDKQCSGKSTSSPAPTSDGNYCSDVRMYRNFEQKCSDEVAAMQKSPDCVGLSEVAKCLSGAVCENGTHLCGKDEMMLAFRYNGNFTRDWLGLDGAKDKCDGMVHSGVCEDVDILTCQLQACSPGTPEEFAILPLDQKCSVWSSMTGCTLSALSAKGKKCSEDGIRKVTSEIAETAFKLDLSTCLK